jgi:hypothetical protein
MAGYAPSKRIEGHQDHISKRIMRERIARHNPAGHYRYGDCTKCHGDSMVRRGFNDLASGALSLSSTGNPGTLRGGFLELASQPGEETKT